MGEAPLSEPKKEPINLLRGWPSTTLLPVDLIKQAANAALSDPSIAQPGLLYGPDPGHEPLRTELASWLTSFYSPAHPVQAERICITGGASQNLGCMLQVFTDPAYTRNIWIVAPAYFLAFRIFEDAGFARSMRAVPEDEEGIDVAFLAEKLRESEEKAKRDGIERPRYKRQRGYAKVYKHVIYCVPTFANPSSRTMSLARRQQLVRLAKEFDALVVADDVYDFLQWPTDDRTATLMQAHLPRLVDIDRTLDGGAQRDGADGFGNAVSNGSFSKILGPGARVGWVEGTPKFAYGVSQTGTTASGGAPSQLTSTYVTHLLKTQALQDHIANTLLPAYTARYSLLMKAIERHLLPQGCSMPQSHRAVVGGYFVWLRLPAGVRAAELVRRAKEDADVIVAPGSIFEVPRYEEQAEGESVEFENEIRLCFAWEAEGNLEEGVRRLGAVLGRMVKDDDGGDGGKRKSGGDIAGFK